MNSIIDENSEDLEKELDMINKNKPIIDIVLSQEQNDIINTKSNVNIKVDAVAGSGKTTTILHMSMANPTKNIFQITYNNLLKREVRKKASRLCINNMEIHTYHSLAVKYYSPSAYTDEEIKKILLSKQPINKKNILQPIDILFIDETQDMILDYYKLVKKFIQDTNSNPQIIILGDRCQGIYDFKGANTKFLTLADKIWNTNFVNLNLSTSYRLTNQISWFVNNIMLGYNRISTIKDGSCVDYYISNPFKIYKKIGKYLVNKIKNKNILPSDIFILVPSLKTIESPYKKLENYLVGHGIKCVTPVSDDTKLDDKTISNKVVFTTYHQAKGRERKIVILYNFDNSYMEYYTRENISSTKICPNILYVGATRASEKLILIQDFNTKPLDFLNITKLKSNEYIKIIYTEKKYKKITTIPKQFKNKSEIKKVNVTDLVKFISPHTLDIIIPLLENNLFIETKPPKTKLISIPNKIEIISGGINIWEDVSDLNGLVIPAILESKLNQSTSTIENYVKEKLQNKFESAGCEKYMGIINIPCQTIRDFLKIGNVYTSLQNRLHAKLAQIKKYNWLSESMVKKAHSYMNMIDTDTLFEITICSNPDSETNLEIGSGLDYFEYIHETYGIIQLRGRLDAVTSDSVWEFKCVDYLSIEHKLQLVIYYWLWVKADMDVIYGKKKFSLINIKSGQILELNITNWYIIKQIMNILFDEKFLEKKVLTDLEFISMCVNYQKN